MQFLQTVHCIILGIRSFFLYFDCYLEKDVSLVPVLKQQFNELINGESQKNRDQNLNLLFLQ